MKLCLAIIFLFAGAVGAAPTQCYGCSGRNTSSCYGIQQSQICATADGSSLGTTHCGSVAIKYRTFLRNDVKYGFFRGCIDCADMKAACFTIGGFLKARVWQTLLQCEIKCCTSNNCNTQTFNLTQNAITVFTPEVAGPVKCQECSGEREEATCTERQRTQTCSRDSNSRLGTTHCGSTKYKFRDSRGEQVGFIRGCIDCTDKNAACAAIGGYLKARERKTIFDCNIDCCTKDNCNDGAPDLPKCQHCAGTDAASCSANQGPQTCAIDRDSLGTTHCASIVGKFRLTPTGNTMDIFYRGCIDCASKKAACFALGGYFKGKNDNDNIVNLLQCEVECCTGNNCNTQVPTLSPNAIAVFTTSASGPKQCNICLENDAASCTKNQQTAICATNLYSMGTSHCGSAVGKYRNRKGDVEDWFLRGCINCADKKAACAAVGAFVKRREEATQLQCAIDCCTDDDCNTKFPSLSKGAHPTMKAAQRGYHISLSGLLAFATAVAQLLNYF